MPKKDGFSARGVVPTHLQLLKGNLVEIGTHKTIPSMLGK